MHPGRHPRRHGRRAKASERGYTRRPDAAGSVFRSDGRWTKAIPGLFRTLPEERPAYSLGITPADVRYCGACPGRVSWPCRLVVFLTRKGAPMSVTSRFLVALAAAAFAVPALAAGPKAYVGNFKDNSVS